MNANWDLVSAKEGQKLWFECLTCMNATKQRLLTVDRIGISDMFGLAMPGTTSDSSFRHGMRSFL